MRGLEAENSVTEGQSQHVHLFPCSQDAGPVSLGHVPLGDCPCSHQPLWSPSWVSRGSSVLEERRTHPPTPPEILIHA